MRDFTVSVGMRRFPTTSILSMICPAWGAAWTAWGSMPNRKKPRISAKGPIRAACLGLVSSKNDEAISLPSEQGGKIQIIRELLLKCHFGMPLIPKSPNKKMNESLRKLLLAFWVRTDYSPEMERRVSENLQNIFEN